MDLAADLSEESVHARVLGVTLIAAIQTVLDDCLMCLLIHLCELFVGISLALRLMKLVAESRSSDHGMHDLQILLQLLVLFRQFSASRFLLLDLIDQGVDYLSLLLLELVHRDLALLLGLIQTFLKFLNFDASRLLQCFILFLQNSKLLRDFPRVHALFHDF